ncbi:hypothetical protein CCP1ISM_1310001 [Azospirillaceae bacterium]
MQRPFSYNIPLEFSSFRFIHFPCRVIARRRGRRQVQASRQSQTAVSPVRGRLRGWTGAGFAVLTALLGAGCGERILETGLTYDYVAESLQGTPPPAPPPRNPLIRHISERETGYPRVYDVPDRPPPLPTAAMRQAEIDRLAADRRAAHLADDLLKEIAPPLPVPPPPSFGKPGAASGPAPATGRAARP